MQRLLWLKVPWRWGVRTVWCRLSDIKRNPLTLEGVSLMRKCCWLLENNWRRENNYETGNTETESSHSHSMCFSLFVKTMILSFSFLLWQHCKKEALDQHALQMENSCLWNFDLIVKLLVQQARSYHSGKFLQQIKYTPNPTLNWSVSNSLCKMLYGQKLW